MPTCLTDEGSFLAISGCIIALVAYLTPCLSHKTYWLKTLLVLLLSQEAYALLAALSPGTWASSLLASVGTVAGLALVFGLAMRSAADIVILGSMLLLLGPWAGHVCGLITAALREHVSDAVPPWFGLALFIALVVGLVLLVWLLRLTRILLAAVFVLVGSVVLFIYVRMAVIEAGTGSTLLCCDFGSLQQQAFWDKQTTQSNGTTAAPPDNSACPLDVSSVQSGMILFGLLLFSCAQVWWWWNRRRPKQYARVVNQSK